jgi:hypothetical protein
MIQITPQMRILAAIEPVDFRNYVKPDVMSYIPQVTNGGWGNF